jgi:hypothetical protein
MCWSRYVAIPPPPPPCPPPPHLTQAHVAGGAKLCCRWGAVQRDDVAGAALTCALGAALRDGKPANFSDEHALRCYTRERLPARCRYLYTLLLCDDPLCAAARQLLLPPPLPPPPPSEGALPPSTPAVTVLSIGGGPGFDDLAMRLLAAFLASMPCGGGEGGGGSSSGDGEGCDGGTDGVRASPPPGAPKALPVPVPVRTVVLDLFDQAWDAAAQAVTSAADRTGTGGGGTLIGPRAPPADAPLRLAHCDVREALDAPGNEALAALTPTAVRPCTRDDHRVAGHSQSRLPWHFTEMWVMCVRPAGHRIFSCARSCCMRTPPGCCCNHHRKGHQQRCHGWAAAWLACSAGPGKMMTQPPFYRCVA